MLSLSSLYLIINEKKSLMSESETHIAYLFLLLVLYSYYIFLFLKNIQIFQVMFDSICVDIFIILLKNEYIQ